MMLEVPTYLPKKSSAAPSPDGRYLPLPLYQSKGKSEGVRQWEGGGLQVGAGVIGSAAGT